MGVEKITAYEWTCDECGRTAETETEDKPKGWTIVGNATDQGDTVAIYSTTFCKTCSAKR
jgi:hypothetical protein